MAVLVWLAAWAAFWWPRRVQGRFTGLIAIVAMVAVGAVLGTSALAPCRGGETGTSVAAGVLGLFTGNPPTAYGRPDGLSRASRHWPCSSAQIICLGATLIGALAAAAVLWREPLARLRARFVKDATIFTGLDPLTMPLLQRLAATGRPRRIVVIEPDDNHSLLEEARATGAHVMVGNPAAERILLPIITGWRGCALSYVYAVRNDLGENEAVLAAVTRILGRRYRRPDPERQPHLVVRIDDPRHADHWRGRHSGTVQPLVRGRAVPARVDGHALADRVFRAGARQLLLCGDSTLALATLLELGHRAWERRELRRRGRRPPTRAMLERPRAGAVPAGARHAAGSAGRAICGASTLATCPPSIGGHAAGGDRAAGAMAGPAAGRCWTTCPRRRPPGARLPSSTAWPKIHARGRPGGPAPSR